MTPAVAWVPLPPLLVPEIAAGSAAADDGLRRAADDAVAALVGSAPNRVLVVAPTAAPHRSGRGSTWSWHGFGVGAPRAGEILPWQLGIGAWLLQRAGWDGDVDYIGVNGPEPLPPVGGTIAVLVLGDGSARGDAKAPGHHDDRAAGWDLRLAELLDSCDLAGIASLDGGLGTALMSTAAVSWPAAAGALAGHGGWTAQVRYADAPYGVGYIVASWSPSA